MDSVVIIVIVTGLLSFSVAILFYPVGLQLSTFFFAIVNLGRPMRGETMYTDFLMDTIKFRGDRLATMMKKRNLKPGQLEYMAGVSQPMISLLLSEQRPNVSAVIVARLADALGCSAEYLVGLTDDPSPVAATLDDALADLLAIAKTLPEHRQRDLLAIANTYRATGEPTVDLMEIMLGQIEEIGGEELLNRVLTALEGMLPPASTRRPGRRAGKLSQDKSN